MRAADIGCHADCRLQGRRGRGLFPGVVAGHGLAK
jgi:hypothetical protein